MTVNDIFDVFYGVNLELNSLKIDKNGINFVSRTSKNNGVSAKVRILPNVDPIPAGTISVAASGSVMESFLQLQPYYSGRDLYYLVPKEPLSDEVKLFYCLCLKSNKYRFSYGRQANITLREIIIPSLDEIPSWVKSFSLNSYRQNLSNSISFKLEQKINLSRGNLVPLEDIFDPINGIPSAEVKRNTIKLDDTYVPYIRPSYRQETSIDAFVSKDSVDSKYIFPSETIYVSTDGQGSHTFSYVSTFEFIPNSNVTVLLPKSKMTLSEKLFYAHCITINRYKFSYGRKPKGDRLKKMLIPDGVPDYISDSYFDSIKRKLLLT